MKIKNLINLFKTNKECYFGADFSGAHLRLMETKKHGKSFDMVGYSQKKIPKGIMDQGKIIKKNEFMEVFNEAVENAEGFFSGKDIMLTIPEENVFARVISIPVEENEKSLEEMVRWETESSIPLAISETYYDWQIIKEDKGKKSILVMATKKDIVDNYLEVFDEMGLNVLALEPESLSMARSFSRVEEKDYSLIIDLGNHSSNFIICKNGLPVFTSSVSISGKTITELIIRKMGLSFEKAERYKIKVGLEKSQSKLSQNIFDPALISLVDEIKKMTEFLKYNLFVEEKNKKIDEIILCGGGSNLKGLSSYLTIKLKQKVSQSNPWSRFNFVKKNPPISKQDSQGFAPVIGLTLKFEDNEND
jgi:type IV pilus assembly protein PilM